MVKTEKKFNRLKKTDICVRRVLRRQIHKFKFRSFCIDSREPLCLFWRSKVLSLNDVICTAIFELRIVEDLW